MIGLRGGVLVVRWNGLHEGSNEKRPGDLVLEILLKGLYELGRGRFWWLFGDFLKAMRSHGGDV